jgi:hypothetical protein
MCFVFKSVYFVGCNIFALYVIFIICRFYYMYHKDVCFWYLYIEKV